MDYSVIVLQLQCDKNISNDWFDGLLGVGDEGVLLKKEYLVYNNDINIKLFINSKEIWYFGG